MKKGPFSLARLLFYCGVILVGCFSFWKTRPPVAVSGDISSTGFSVGGAMRDLEEISRNPHPMGSAELLGVRNYLLGRWEQLGFSPVVQEETVPDYFDVVPGADTAAMANILVRWPGSRPTKAVALMGHYDSAPASPGANDDASAVAVILEVARLIRAGPPLENDLIFILTDGEEPAPRFGATAFVRRHPWFKDLGLVVNLDALGGTGPSTLLETGGDNLRLLREFRKAVQSPVAFSYTYDILRRFPENPTDFGSFLKTGIPGYNLAYTQDSTVYHTRMDNARRVDPRSVWHQGATALALARRFGRFNFLEESLSGRKEAVYFSVFQRLVLLYPQSWALPLGLGITLLAGGLFIAMGKTGRLSLPRWGRGILLQLGAILASMVSAGIGWWVIVGVRQGNGKSISPAETWLWGGALFLLAIAAARGVLGIPWNGKGRPALLEGGLFWWWFFSILTAFLLPGWSCLFLWPLLFAVAGTALAKFGRKALSGDFPGQGTALIVASVMIVTLTPAAVDFFHLAQPRPGNPESQVIQLIVIPALFLSLGLGVIGPLREAWAGPPFFRGTS